VDVTTRSATQGILMQPVQFQCGHCGKLMAVSSQHLGQQVRCPHCQQVVIAPPPAPAQPGETPTQPAPLPVQPAPSPGLPETVQHTPAPADAADDIFSAGNVTSELFNYSETPRLDIPAGSLPLTLAGAGNVPSDESQPTLASTVPWAPQQPAAELPVPLVPFAQSEKTAVLPGGGAPLWKGDALTEALLPGAPVPVPSLGEPPAASTRPTKQTETKAPWFLLLVFCPLLLYAIVISIFAFFIYRHDQQLQEQLRKPFEGVPDVGDDPGVRKSKKVSLTDGKYTQELVKMQMPESLCTNLGKPLRVGQLRVTPNRVERQRVSVVVEASRPEPCPNDSLVLYLDLKNLSDDYAFAPLDNYFDRYWRAGEDPIPPLTLLEVSDKYRFYGGPAHWYPRGDPHNRREWVKGRRDQADLLQPGEEKQMFVCTDGYDDKAAAVLFGERLGGKYDGPFLWRIRVRRGTVRVGEKDYSATAVIGVRFTHSDIRQAAPDVQ
jgi:phage FluMu protein Com